MTKEKEKEIQSIEDDSTEPNAPAVRYVFVEDRGGESRRNYSRQGENYGYHQSV